MGFLCIQSTGVGSPMGTWVTVKQPHWNIFTKHGDNGSPRPQEAPFY